MTDFSFYLGHGIASATLAAIVADGMTEGRCPLSLIRKLWVFGVVFNTALGMVVI